ncbi:ADP-ribosylglycohydrolase [Dothidotthia symphoricarpi CBS 119687]|uniref:ADP-ribosylglycohydrolase n=1 Tax=Dothidotthia symphoricarpi CBS 119687 TaxID=1392245 RepID=A0A6A6A9K8_9PLEO|nr:ADP-ribosylglycohydrolase [Dothidotthia symphoricarpi CBS 119687]KAF2127528.1 ADP-ribosylglycohydrolase [Dothidotthia symphoricarpi CBS 119687]
MPSQPPFPPDSLLSKLHGCIFGSALGDTLGLYTEFLSQAQSTAIYPSGRFRLVPPTTPYHLDAHRLRWPEPFARRLHIWVSQGLLALNRPAMGIGALVGSVVGAATFLADPVGTATRAWIASGRKAAPNGSLMRTHPVGVMGVLWSEAETWRLSVSLGRVTHVDPRCVVACCVSVGLVRGLLRGEVVTEGHVDGVVERAFEWVGGQPGLVNPGGNAEQRLDYGEFSRHAYAPSLEALRLDSPREIGYVYKCLGAAVLLLRLAMRGVASAESGASTESGVSVLFETLITSLILQGGDADTNAAAAGALLGAYLGYSNLPLHWVDGLQHREWLMAKSVRFAVAVGAVEGGTLEEESDEGESGAGGLMTERELGERRRVLREEGRRRVRERRKEIERGSVMERNQKPEDGR